LNVARGTFYNHIYRKADRTNYLQKQEALMLLVNQVFDDSMHLVTATFKEAFAVIGIPVFTMLYE